jgi:hypothetical protein
MNNRLYPPPDGGETQSGDTHTCDLYFGFVTIYEQLPSVTHERNSAYAYEIIGACPLLPVCCTKWFRSLKLQA